ncbi:uncharacterized protein LOC135948292 isoform X2 [Cloeon dipterum]|uniref:uncharacterized protein LOC135948292 isoform X2 n=1 Tax=Cloeon dipterum TaxID=197152 RepID=UPI0032202515
MVKNVIISLFLIFSIDLKLTASVDFTCLMKELVDMQEFTWRHADTPFNCIANCHSAFAAISDSTSQKAKYFERVFSPFQKTINCTKEERRVTASCKVKIKSLELDQLSNLPLIYFPSFVQVRRFEAEKFCALHGLNFGIDESLMGFVAVVKIWMADVETQNTSKQVTCLVFYKKNSSSQITQETCQNRNNFVCVLPKNCHMDRCWTNCSKNQSCNNVKNDNYCESNCPNTFCGDEKADKFGYKPDDGELLEACGKQYIFSRAPRFNQNTTQLFCCTKHMSAGSVSSLDEAKCLAREMIKRNIGDVPFWTSARPSNCTDFSTWCALNGSGEVVDQTSLQIINKRTNPKKQFVTVKANVQTESLTFEFEDPAVMARAMCSRMNPLSCTESLCSPMGFIEQIEQNRKAKKTAFYRASCKFIYGCNKIFDVCIVAYPYYAAAKWTQASSVEYRTVMLTLETQEKMECFLKLMKANNIMNGTFHVNAVSFGCPKSNRWCQIPEDPFLNNSYIPWAKGEPSMDPSKECVIVKYDADKISFTFTKNSCKYSPNLRISQTIDFYPEHSFGLS